VRKILLLFCFNQHQHNYKVEWLLLDTPRSVLDKQLAQSGARTKWVSAGELHTEAVGKGTRKCFDLVEKVKAAKTTQTSLRSFFEGKLTSLE
jgi:hypothetical protein